MLPRHAPGHAILRFSQAPHRPSLGQHAPNGPHMNQIIYIVGFVVIVLIILGFFGLR
jgi:hypothetical protein